MSAPKHKWWQTRRVAAEQYARVLEEQIVSLHRFVEEELDPDPAPWAAYYNERRFQIVAEFLQSREKLARVWAENPK